MLPRQCYMFLYLDAASTHNVITSYLDYHDVGSFDDPRHQSVLACWRVCEKLIMAIEPSLSDTQTESVEKPMGAQGWVASPRTAADVKSSVIEHLVIND